MGSAQQAAIKGPDASASLLPLASRLLPSDWLPIGEAARRTRLTVRAWRFRCPELERRGLARLAPPPSGRGRPAWQVHRSADCRLAISPELSGRNTPDLGRYPAHHVERAGKRLRWVKRWQVLCGESPHKRKRELAGWVVAEANSDDPALKISVRSLEAWEGNYHREGFKGLIDRYGVTAITRTGTGASDHHRSSEAVQFFYDIYHTNQRRTVRQCHELALSEARRHNWQWPSDYSATTTWLTRYDDKATTCLMREGMEVWRHKFMPYLEQDYTKLSAGDMYVCDHHEFKCFARYRGKTIRPWLTGIMDAATRVLVGWHVGPAPHTDAILASIRNAFEGWGVPRRVKIDNGKDYDSKVLTGTTKAELRKLKRELGKDWKNIIRREQAKTGLNPCEWFGVLPAFGCKIIRAIPYQPQSKLIERYFLTVSDQFTRSLATFCDTSPERKPEALPEVLEDIAAIPALEDLATDFAAWLEEYHHAAHRGDGMNGRSPLAAWESSPAQPAKAQADALGLMVNVRGAYKVGGNGVRVKIGATTIGYGQYDTSLQRWKGRKVLVAVASSDVSYALIYTPERAKRQLICRAEANERISPCATADDMREAQASINRARRDARRARDSAAATMKTTARVVREAAAHRRKELLRATGTDNATSSTGVPPVNGKTSSTGGTGISPASPAPITLVQTGFEEAAKQVRKTGVEQSLSSAQTQNEQRSPIVDFTAINDWMVGRSEPDETDKPAIANADAMLTTGSLNGDLLGDDWMPGGNESDESDKPAIANADAMLTTGCLDDDPILTDLDREDGSAAVDAFGTLERLIHGPRT